MNSNLIFWPLLTQIALIFFVFMRLGVEKSRAMKSGGVDMTKTALDNDAWPDNVLKVSNNLRNQFQLPVLFFALCLVFFSLDAITTVVLSLAWAFVISRIIHAWIHMGSNYVPARFRVFLFGTVILILMLISAVNALLA